MCRQSVSICQMRVICFFRATARRFITSKLQKNVQISQGEAYVYSIFILVSWNQVWWTRCSFRATSLRQRWTNTGDHAIDLHQRRISASKLQYQVVNSRQWRCIWENDGRCGKSRSSSWWEAVDKLIPLLFRVYRAVALLISSSGQLSLSEAFSERRIYRLPTTVRASKE